MAGAKCKHKAKIIEYIGNPENEVPTRKDLSINVCGVSQQTLYRHFTPDELFEIEKEGLALRRTKYATLIAKTDHALFKVAANGDVSAIKLIYQRFEGWSEKKIAEFMGEVGLKHDHHFDSMDLKKFHEAIANARSQTSK